MAVQPDKISAILDYFVFSTICVQITSLLLITSKHCFAVQSTIKTWVLGTKINSFSPYRALVKQNLFLVILQPRVIHI